MAKKKSTGTQSQSTAQKSTNPGLERKYSADKSTCVVTFRLPKDAAPDALQVAVCGTFNNWDPNSHPLKKLKNGDFALEVTLEAGKEYEFRFIVDGTRWENAWNADKYVRSTFGDSENSVIVI